MLLVNRISPLSSEPIKIRDYSCVINTNVDKVLDSRISNIKGEITNVEVLTRPPTQSSSSLRFELASYLSNKIHSIKKCKAQYLSSITAL